MAKAGASRQGRPSAPIGGGKLLGIGATSKLTKLSERTLRYWETVGLLLPVRTPGGHRKYTSDQVKELLRLKGAVKKGNMRLSDLMTSREMIHDEALGKRVQGMLPSRFVDSEIARGPSAGLGLHDNFFVQQEINRRLSSRMPTAVCYLDVHNLTAYARRYGYDRADKLVSTIGLVIFDTVRDAGNKSDVLGQLAPDHFLIVTTTDRVDPICSQIVRAFDELVPLQYDDEDRRRGHIVVKTRKGEEEKQPFLRLAIGVVSNAQRSLTNYLHVKDIATELRKLADRYEKSAYFVDRRKN